MDGHDQVVAYTDKTYCVMKKIEDDHISNLTVFIDLEFSPPKGQTLSYAADEYPDEPRIVFEVNDADHTTFDRILMYNCAKGEAAQKINTVIGMLSKEGFLTETNGVLEKDMSVLGIYYNTRGPNVSCWVQTGLSLASGSDDETTVAMFADMTLK